MIKLFERYYNMLDKLKNTNINSNINLYAHKDRVGFFVVGEKKKNTYILKIYGKISDDVICNLSELFSFKSGNIKIEVLEKYNKFVFIKSDKKLKNSDFLMYVPRYIIKGGYLIGPYLDNIIGNIVADRFKNEVNVYRSIDEEAKLIYSKFNNKGTSIVLDTIWQDYINKKINLDKIYNVSRTKFTIGKELDYPEVENIELKLNFKTEIDFINSEDKYLLLCPIENGHNPDAKVKLSTLETYINALGKLIKNLNEKNIGDLS